MIRYTLAMSVSNRTRFFWYATSLSVGITSACGDPPKTLNVAIPPWEETLNPLITNNLSTRQIVANVYESLLRIDDEGNVIPGLASGWEWDATGTILTLTLNDGIRFHDGAVLNADVVVESLKRAVEYSASSNLGSFFTVPFLGSARSSIRKVDDNTVSIHLSGPHYSLVRTLATPQLTPIMGTRAVMVSGMEFSTGTGRFRLTRFDWEGGLLVLDRFDQYWNSPTQPQRLKFIAVSDAEDALRMLRDGSADLSLTISASEVSEIYSNESVALVTGPHVNYLVIGMNNQRPPFNNRDARRALAMGLDRERLVEEAYKGAATPKREFIVQGLFPNAVSPPAPDYDPESAKELIDSSISSGERGVTIVFPPLYSPERQHWLYENLLYMLDPLGLQPQPRYTSSWDEHTSLVSEMEWDVSLDGMVSDNGDLYEFLHILYGHPSPAGGTGVFGLDSEELSDVLEAARSSTDPEERIRHYENALAIIAREIPCVPLCTRANFIVRSSEVEPFELGVDISRVFSEVRKKGWR